nr:hypothetical protein [Candidatus Freyarchaeota archaeon]
MVSGIRWYKKLNSLKSMGEVIDFINELEAKSYHVPEFFSDSKDSLPYQKATCVNDLPFLDEDNVKISNFENFDVTIWVLRVNYFSHF